MSPMLSRRIYLIDNLKTDYRCRLIKDGWKLVRFAQSGNKWVDIWEKTPRTVSVPSTLSAVQ